MPIRGRLALKARRGSLRKFLGNFVLQLRDAIAGVGVGAHEFGLATAAAFGLQHLHHFYHGVGVVAGFGGEIDGQLISLQFIVAAKFEADDFRYGSGYGRTGNGTARVLRVVGGNASGPGQALREVGLGHLLGRVPAHNMTNFVGQYPGQLALSFRVFENALGDEYLPTRQGESVDCLVVGQQMKLKFVGRFGIEAIGSHNLLTRLLHGGAGPWVGTEATVLGRHFGGRLQTQCNFLARRHRDMLGFARYVIF